mgnify:CR=1 FL=1
MRNKCLHSYYVEDMKEKSEIDVALEKLQRYCIYQDRCEQEVYQKLRKFDISELEKEDIVETLKDDDFLNEERFAEAYVIGKFKSNSWGKNKIKYHLLQKKVDDMIINRALQGLDEEEYKNRLRELLKKKNERLRESDKYKRKDKLMRYAYQKGFETGLIYQIINEITPNS